MKYNYKSKDNKKENRIILETNLNLSCSISAVEY